MNLGNRADTGELRKQFKFHALFVVAAFLLLIGRLFYLQVLQRDEYQAEAKENIVRRVTLATTRGVVRDSQGKVIASNRPAYSVYLVPMLKVDRKLVCITETEVWSKVVSYLSLPQDERLRAEKKLGEICADPRSDPRARKFQQFLLREDIGRDVVATLETHASELRGVDVAPAPVRYYPYGELSAHILGYMAEVDAELLARLRAAGYTEGDRIGAAGVERAWESYLRGQRGWEKVIVDARNQRRSGPDAERLLDEPRSLQPVPGRDLRLSLDIELVDAIDQAMRGQIAGSVVVVDVRTGRVLALYSKPSFDPNILSGGSGKQAIRDAFRRLYGDPLLPTLDKTMSGSYPPGSTYKPFTALAALEPPSADPSRPQRSVLDPRTRVNCRGFINYGKRLFRCTHVHGPVDMRQAIVQSCNVYFYEIADRLATSLGGSGFGLDALAHWGMMFGLGQKTGMGANPESAGRIPTYTWYTTHYKGQFRGGFTLNAAIGQGATTVSVLQLALAYAALANGGTLYQPQLVRAVETSDGAIVQDFSPRVKRRIEMRPEHWRLIVDGLRGVVQEAEGTAHSERLADVEMSGKTGTAQTSHKGVHGEDASRVWYFNRDHAWFAGFSPSRAPEIAVAVLIEHGGAGGKNAAPVAFLAARAYQKLTSERLAAKASPPPPPKPTTPSDKRPKGRPKKR
ncbi:MAG: penicillin-binding protein 2 [Polyangiaceae bacterium]|nr:penicillin-binding protein 2 [Polyangiaceae bacterium]